VSKHARAVFIHNMQVIKFVGNPLFPRLIGGENICFKENLRQVFGSCDPYI